MSTKGRGVAPIDVLLVEDSPGDVRLTQEAFQELDANVRLHVARDGVEAIAFLTRAGSHFDAPRPDLILLDLNMPILNGMEVLTCIKADASLKLIPVIMLTISDSEEDIVKAYELGANCYLGKPVELGQFEAVVKSVNDFWLGAVKRPHGSSIGVAQLMGAS